MARFNKINNRKGRIIRTYEKLNFTENKIAHLVKKQENLLRKVTLDVLTSTAERNATLSDCDPSKTEHYISYVTQLDIFSKLLATTLSVKRELEIIKSYSKRLIIIEEERNSLGKLRIIDAVGDSDCLRCGSSFAGDCPSVKNLP